MSDQSSVEDYLDELDGKPKAEAPKGVQPFKPAVLDGTPDLPAPGIYFGMSDEDYHALPALSSSGVKKAAGSPMIFWASTTWLNQKKRDAEAEEDKLHQTLGKAYHCRIMEGREQYDARFCVGLAAEDVEGALVSTDQIKAAIKAKDRPPFTKVEDTMPDGTAYMRAAKKDDWVAQLLDLDPTAKILSVMEAQHREANDGKTLISAEDHARIEIAARMVEQDPEIRHAFRGGYAEVTLIWYCPKTGVPMKARADYLKRDVCVDLKSIANTHEKSMEQAIRNAIASHKYVIQPSVYSEGIREVRRLVREGTAVIHLCSEFSYSSTAEEVATFVDKWSKSDKLAWVWVFQQKGDAPITRACSYPLQGSTKLVTDEIVSRAKKDFRKYSETFGTDPWVDVKPIYDLADEDLPPWATDI